MLNRGYEMAELQTPKEKKIKWHADVHTQERSSVGGEECWDDRWLSMQWEGLVLRLMQKLLTGWSTLGCAR